MQETNEFSQQQGLVPIRESSRPRFDLSPKQIKDVNDLMFSYIRRHKLPFTTATSQAVQLIIAGDALERGMKEEGISTISPQDNLKKIVQKGLALRTDLVQEGIKIINETLSDFNKSESSYVGPYAISQGLLARASQELKNHTIKASLGNVDELRNVFDTRRKMLPKITNEILQALPKELFPEASLDKFPQAPDQAKIIRNMIASLVFRENPLPTFSMIELQSFMQKYNQEKEKFSPLTYNSFVPILSEKTGHSTADIGNYMAELMLQLKEFFDKSDLVLKREKINVAGAEIDSMYNFFSRSLLLLHPALEEQHIVTDIKSIAENSLSLWSPEMSTEINGYRVPTLSALQRAIRLFDAQEKHTGKFEAAILAWKTYDRNIHLKQKRLIELRKTVQNAQSSSKEARKSNYYPTYYFTLAKSLHVKAGEEYDAASHTLNQNERIINLEKKELDALREYENQLLHTFGIDLPEMLPAPQWVLENRKRTKSSKYERLKKRVQRREEKAEQILRDDFFYEGYSEQRKRPVALSMVSTDVLQQDLSALKTMLEQAKSGNVIPEKGAGITLENLIDFSRSTIRRLLYKKIQERKKMSGILGKDLKISEVHLDNASERELIVHQNLLKWYKATDKNRPTSIPAFYSRYSLGRRIEAIEKILEARQQKSIEETRKNEPIETTITREEFEQLRKNILISQSPFKAIGSHEEKLIISAIWPQLQAFSRNILSRSIPFPLVFPARNELMAWVNTELAKQEKFEFTQRNKEQFLKNFLIIVDNPLFPTDELEGLQREEALELLRRRFFRMYAHLHIEDMRERYETRRKKIEELAKNVYQQNLEYGEENARKELRQTELRSPEDEFVKKMVALELAQQI